MIGEDLVLSFEFLRKNLARATGLTIGLLGFTLFLTFLFIVEMERNTSPDNTYPSALRFILYTGTIMWLVGIIIFFLPEIWAGCRRATSFLIQSITRRT